MIHIPAETCTASHTIKNNPPYGPQGMARKSRICAKRTQHRPALHVLTCTRTRTHAHSSPPSTSTTHSKKPWFLQSLDFVFKSLAAPITRHLSQRHCHVETTWSRCSLAMVACAPMDTKFCLSRKHTERTQTKRTISGTSDVPGTTLIRRLSSRSSFLVCSMRLRVPKKEVCVCPFPLQPAKMHRFILFSSHPCAGRVHIVCSLRAFVFSHFASHRTCRLPCTCACPLAAAACFDCSCVFAMVSVRFSFRPVFGIYDFSLCQFHVNSFPLFPIGA